MIRGLLQIKPKHIVYKTSHKKQEQKNKQTGNYPCLFLLLQLISLFKKEKAVLRVP